MSAAPCLPASRSTNPLVEQLAPEAELYEALVLGTRDYCRKNGFTDVVIGLSGGIDSSLVAVIAAEALGAEHVHGVSMPSRYSSDHSKSDARALAENLGIEYRTIPIEPAFTAFLDMLVPSFEGRPPGLTQENLQSRCRGPGADGAVQRVRLDGPDDRQQERDGGRLLHDLRRLRRRVRRDQGRAEDRGLRAQPLRQRAGRSGGHPRGRAHQAAVGRAAGRTSATTRACRPTTCSTRSSRLYVEDDRTAAEIVELGHDEAIVRRVTRLVDLAEYKRRQSPPGVRVTTKAFGRDRRMPITNGYR